MQAVSQGADEVGVAGELAGGDGGELVHAEAQISRRWPEPGRGGPLAVARVAVAGAADGV